MPREQLATVPARSQSKEDRDYAQDHSPKHESHAEQRNAITEREDHDGKARFAEGILDVVIEQVIVAVANSVFHRKTGDSADRTDALRRKLGTFGKDGIVGGLEAGLVSHAVEHGCHDNGHGCAERNESELPAEDETDNDAANDVE